MRALQALVVGSLVLAAVLPALGQGSRVARDGYVAGTGDLGCLVKGLGCVDFYVEGGESAAAIAAQDDLHNPVGFDACSPDCNANMVSFCGSGSIGNLHPGELLFIFLSEARGPLSCGLPQAGIALKGNVTAIFT